MFKYKCKQRKKKLLGYWEKKRLQDKEKLTLNYEKGELNNNHDISDRFEDEFCYLSRS
jgi:hypothetical protein